MRIAVVGICGSGKSVLAEGLRHLGYEVRECHQEHSNVPYMWQAISRPDVLIYLDASSEVAHRRGSQHYIKGHAKEQRKRLAHAREHCDLYVLTDDLIESQVLERVVEFLGCHAAEKTARSLTDG
jgi:UDP-N-acetylmuramate-alanine ligase